MTTENQRDEAVARTIIDGVVRDNGVEVFLGEGYGADDDLYNAIVSALTSLRQTWEREKKGLEAKNAELLEENKRLREFVEYVLASYCWDECEEPDGEDLQDKAELLGLIELRKVKPEDNDFGAEELYFPVWTPKEADA